MKGILSEAQRSAASTHAAYIAQGAKSLQASAAEVADLLLRGRRLSAIESCNIMIGDLENMLGRARMARIALEAAEKN